MSQDIEQIFDDVRKYCTLAEKESIQSGTATTMAEISISIEMKYFGSDCSILLEFFNF